MAVDPDPRTRAEVERLLRAGDDAGLAARFQGSLEFGTAGLRGPMGAGPNRMNRVVVRRATAGLMEYLPPDATVVIGHDSRRNSDVFARDVARVVAGAGGHARLLPCHAPTPLVAFAVRHLGADAGVVCTASHNPPGDNGYKVYLADGAQILPPADARIADAIERSEPVLASDGNPLVQMLDDETERAYVDHVARLMPWSAARRDVRVVYSALHGVGTRLTEAVFGAAGFAPLHLVDAQCSPDGSFPTVSVPNPELAEATRLSHEALAVSEADVALVHDPDADRLGVIVRDGGGTRSLTGNEIGLLLADHILSRGAGAERLVVDTVVSSSALAAVAAAYGVHHRRTLTGFKWIVRPAMDRPDLRFVFGYEEALGFSVDAYVRDKDAISAAVVFSDLVATLRTEGRTVTDRLEELARRHGLFATSSWSRPAQDAAQLGAAMARLRAAVPRTIGDSSVVSVSDYARGGALPPADLLEIELEPRARLAIRPSGTEARLKVYAEVVVEIGADVPYATAVAETSLRLDALRTAMEPLLDTLMND
jgi:phosphomannomutase